MKSKPNFNGATEKFSRCIYDSAKGKVRLAVLKRDLAELHGGRPLRILDVGAGMGQMALWFAQAGHHISLCDVSEEMLTQAENTAKEQGLAQQMVFCHSSLADLPAELGTFDLVICHAVLEWIEPQAQFIELLSQRLNSQGHLSLMAFNRKALLFNHLVAGNFEYVQGGMQRRSRQRLTPNWPVDPDLLQGWLQQQGLEIERLSGVRIFSDYVRDKELLQLDEKRVLELELEQSSDLDWLPVARYLHYLVRHSDLP